MGGRRGQANLALAVGLVLSVVVIDPRVVEHWGSADGEIGSATRGILRILQVLLGGAAVLLVRLRQRIDPTPLAVLALGLALGAGLAEAVLVTAIRTTWLDRLGPLRAVARQIYREDRSYVQYREDCALYDAALAYRLRPGRCRFATPEFDTRLEVNHLGLRDDEASLEAPEVIVLGDSYAMGWGVGQHESFPELLEAATGLRVLNAGVPSYGTPRELLMLRRLDRSGLRILVIEHCTDNDFAENRSFVEHRGRLPVMSAAAYADRVAAQGGAHGYFPGRYLWSAFRSRLLSPALAWAQGSLGEAPEEVAATDAAALRVRMDPGDQARQFLAVLELSPVELRGISILVLDLSSAETRDDGFVTALAEAVRNGRGPQDLEVLRLGQRLDERDYFRLDEHLNRAGHRHVAELLAERIVSRATSAAARGGG